MAEVRQVRDTGLNRTLAMKLLHPRLARHDGAKARFLEEVQATGQLRHPGIVPVHDLGALPDGRLWFTMKEVRGRPLTDVIGEVHAASPERWEPARSGWTFRRLNAAFMQACHEAVLRRHGGRVSRAAGRWRWVARPCTAVWRASSE